MAESSYNGWPVLEADQVAGDFQVAGVPFPGGVCPGEVAAVFTYFLGNFHHRVEPLVSGWCWGYERRRNSNQREQWSCHASGTAVDVNAPDHPSGAGGTFSDGQRQEIHRILDELGGALAWLEGYDEMHFEIRADADQLAAVVASLPREEPEDMTLTDEDIAAVADAVMARMRGQAVVRYNKTDAATGKETALDGSITDALGAAATYSGRAVHLATKIDNGA
jgi:hypothetical protein